MSILILQTTPESTNQSYVKLEHAHAEQSTSHYFRRVAPSRDWCMQASW